MHETTAGDPKLAAAEVGVYVAAPRGQNHADAGKMKFAANMKMPPSLEREMRDKIEDSLY